MLKICEIVSRLANQSAEWSTEPVKSTTWNAQGGASQGGERRQVRLGLAGWDVANQGGVERQRDGLSSKRPSTLPSGPQITMFLDSFLEVWQSDVLCQPHDETFSIDFRSINGFSRRQRPFIIPACCLVATPACLCNLCQANYIRENKSPLLPSFLQAACICKYGAFYGIFRNAAWRRTVLLHIGNNQTYDTRLKRTKHRGER